MALELLLEISVLFKLVFTTKRFSFLYSNFSTAFEKADNTRVKPDMNMETGFP